MLVRTYYEFIQTLQQILSPEENELAVSCKESSALKQW